METPAGFELNSAQVAGRIGEFLDLAAGKGQVMGRSGVSVLRGGDERRFKHGHSLPLSELGPFHQPLGEAELPAEVAALAHRAQPETPPEAAPSPPAEVLLLAKEREAARARRDWAAADALRGQIAALGWQVLDTRAGPQLEWTAQASRPCTHTGEERHTPSSVIPHGS